MAQKPSAGKESSVATSAHDGVAALVALYDEVAKCGRCGFCQPFLGSEVGFCEEHAHSI
ncbi:MAG: hypothetical protein M1274_05355 [Actinobacteria bacterium]|nr:hypothetical protein [Actinomycetota bacterium]